MTPSWMTDPSLLRVATVARRLGELRDGVVFVGGAVLPLLLTDPAAGAPRPTDDVDLAVELTTLLEYHRLGDRLRALGFREDDAPGAPICRWLVDGSSTA
jgi:hypothetical protein